MSQTVNKTANHTNQTANGVDHEPTLQDVLQAVNVGFTELTKDVVGIKTEISGINGDITGIKGEITVMKSDISGIKTDITGIKGEITVMKSDISGIKEDIVGINGEISQIKQDMINHVTKDELKEGLAQLKTQLVTKDYLDEKMAEQRSDIVLITRKEDRKVVALVHELRDQKVLSEPAAQRILALEPFPQ